VWAIARSQRGQTTVEWVGLVVLVSVLLLAVITAASGQVPGASLARAIAAKIVCALELGDTCATEPDLVAAYGVETAELVREHAPLVFYEEGMTALPVDYRDCRESECSVSGELGEVTHTDTGLPVTAFVHVVDCREPAEAPPGVDCSPPRAGKLYLQYWFYYVDSATLEGEGLQKEAMAAVGRPGYHPDDWESYQVRIGPHGAQARAGSHHGYNYEGGPRNWASDAGVDGVNDAIEGVGLREKKGWGPETGVTWVSGGSHAGHVKDDLAARAVQGDYRRWTTPNGLTLIPLEPIAAEDPEVEFAIVAPWLKEVWHDAEFDSG
jgi:Flp pilus assembly pilin Flp